MSCTEKEGRAGWPYGIGVLGEHFFVDGLSDVYDTFVFDVDAARIC